MFKKKCILANVAFASLLIFTSVKGKFSDTSRTDDYVKITYFLITKIL